MEGICAGFRPGSSALADDGTSVGRQNVVPVGDLGAADDPLGWHEREALPAVAMRRARRIDVWNEPGEIHVDAMFRDTAHDPGGYEVAVHEYRLTAVADSATRCLVDVTAEPRVLPYPECPAAAGNVGRLVGQPLATLRSTVLAMLRSTESCTHLNDALRSLAEVPTLAAALDHAG
jgi:hypothetical protein